MEVFVFALFTSINKRRGFWSNIVLSRDLEALLIIMTYSRPMIAFLAKLVLGLVLLTFSPPGFSLIKIALRFTILKNFFSEISSLEITLTFETKLSQIKTKSQLSKK